MSKSRRGLANLLIQVRVNRETKEAIKSLAKSNGVSMSVLLIEGALKGKVNNRHLRKADFTAIIEITKEMNRIGNNINQIAVALHQVNMNRRIESGEYNLLQHLLTKYLESRNELKNLLLSVQFNELA